MHFSKSKWYTQVPGFLYNAWDTFLDAELGQINSQRATMLDNVKMYDCVNCQTFLVSL